MNLKFLSTAVLGLISATAAQDADTETPTDTNATVITDNQPLSFHHASLLKKDNTTVYGDITITTRDHSSALQVDVRIGGIPEGEYLNYHIHASRVPEDGNCYLTGSHLDPHGRGQEPPCTITAPQTCEVGDLSGKHGPAWAPEGQEFHATYTDFFLANTPGHEAYFGDLSWVVHAPNSDRLTCGNFEGFSGAGFGGWDLGRDGKA